MKNILLLLITAILFTAFTTPGGNMVTNESEAQTYLKLYTSVTGTADNKQENWLLANNGTRRIIATIEIVAAADAGGRKEKKQVIVEPKTSLQLGVRSSNGSAPNNIVIIKAVFTPAT